MELRPDASRRLFWSRQRFRYNVALLVSGALAGFAFFAVLIARELWPEVSGAGPHAASREVISLVGGLLAFAAAVVAANLLYSLAPRVEALLRPRDPDRFRRRAFSAGLALSICLPWAVPLAAWVELVLQLRG